MKRNILSVFAVLMAFATAGQTWTQFETPPTGAYSSELVADYSGENFVLIPGYKGVDSLYTKTGNGSWQGWIYGQYVYAFYANNGDLYVVEDTDLGADFAPKLYVSSDNGATLTEITGISGEFFARDRRGNIFFTTPNGFRYSNNDGSTFTDVNTPETAYSAALDVDGNLYFGADSSMIYKSNDNGSTWSNISKSSYTTSALIKVVALQVENGVIYFDDKNGSLHYGTESDASWSSIQPGATSTSWVSRLTITPDLSYYVQSPYGLYGSTTWGTWSLLMETITVGNPGWYGYYQNLYTLTNNAIYAKTDSGWATTARTENPIGINNLNNQIEVSLYPNPATNSLYLQGLDNNESLSVSVFNAQGQLMLTSEKAVLDVNPLPSGLYLARVSQGGKVGVVRFVRE